MSESPPIVLECPECGEKYLVSRDSLTPSEKATIFSDGFYFDEFNWRTPLIIGCVTCDLGFFPENGKVIAEPSWDEFYEKWSQIKKAEPPTAGSLVLELRARKKMQRNEELALRKELWYAGLHSDTGRLLISKNEKFKKFYTNSLIQLEELLSEDNEELLIKAEINRQLGNFDRCLELLINSNNPIAIQLKEQAQNKNTIIFKIS